jgi:DNA-binding NtrC family response regulator
VITDDAVAYHPLPSGGDVSLGRSSQNSVQLADASISRFHALISLGVPMCIRDVGSANGVRVRGRALRENEAAEFAVGEPIRLGAVTVLVQRGTTETREANVASAASDSDANAIIVSEPAMKQLHALIQRVANTTMAVLILGETGAGKEVVAEAVHRASPRCDGPFVGINCAALSPTLLESELFGHEKGAFTGAQAARPGLIESADGGTFFLDEVGELSTDLQSKLLRVLETRQILRVGASRPRTVDVRFIAATNRDLEAEAEAGTFRRDLYFRLNGVTLVVPPLRERVGEIDQLVALFAARAAASANIGYVPVFAPEALGVLRQHRWPGNVRELKNVVERAVLLSGSETITVEHLPASLLPAGPLRNARTASTASDASYRSSDAVTDEGLRGSLEEIERRKILDALERCGGNQTRAAGLLGIPRRTLTRRLEEYGVPRPRKR